MAARRKPGCRMPSGAIKRRCHKTECVKGSKLVHASFTARDAEGHFKRGHTTAQVNRCIPRRSRGRFVEGRVQRTVEGLRGLRSRLAKRQHRNRKGQFA